METAVNEVLYEFNDLGALEREYQDHTGAVNTETTLYVQYNYDEAISGGEYTKGMRLKSVRYPNTRLVHYLYVDAGGSSGVGDKISRVTAISAAATRPDETDVYSAYSYNGGGRTVLEDYVQPDVRLDYWGQASGTYAGFDRFGRVKQQLWRYYGGTPADRDKFTYEYDRNSNRLGRHNAVAGDRGETYQYDSLNRLVDFAFNKGDINSASASSRNQTWTLDQVGNWRQFVVKQDSATVLDQHRANNKANEITSISTPQSQTQWAEPRYDARGNMITVPKPDSPASAFTCVYDAWNRLVEINSGSNVVLKFEYDGLNRRIKKFINTGDDQVYDEFRHFFYNVSWQVLETRKSTSENTQPETLQPEYQYVWSLRYIDALVLRDRDTGGDPDLDERLYYLNDANMNVTALADDSGDIVERYEYDPYGRVTIYTADYSQMRESSEYDNVILYCGYYHDPETGLYHVRNRMYHPWLSWVQRDPLGYVDGMSLYEYVASCPTGDTDPSGTDRWYRTIGHAWVTYPIYDAKCCVLKYRECDFGPTYTSKTWYGTFGEVAVNLIGAFTTTVKGEVRCQTVKKPSGKGIKTSCEADRKLHFLIRRMEADPPRYSWFCNCQLIAVIWLKAGRAAAAYEARAKLLHAISKAYDNLARLNAALGRPTDARLEKRMAEKHAMQAKLMWKEAQRWDLYELFQSQCRVDALWAANKIVK